MNLLLIFIPLEIRIAPRNSQRESEILWHERATPLCQQTTMPVHLKPSRRYRATKLHRINNFHRIASFFLLCGPTHSVYVRICVWLRVCVSAKSCEWMLAVLNLQPFSPTTTLLVFLFCKYAASAAHTCTHTTHASLSSPVYLHRPIYSFNLIN